MLTSDIWGKQYVSYDIPSAFLQQNEWSYVVAKFPKKGSLVFPYRQRQIARRGYSELFFEQSLKIYMNKEILILGDVNILLSENYRPYEPDIALIDTTNASIRIDIEIDEPYNGLEKKPIHYINCGDDFRDKRLVNVGWIVVRFTEEQIIKELMECIAYLARLIHALNPSINIPNKLVGIKDPIKQNRWSEIEAKIMAINKIREHYLHHDFGFQEEEPIATTDIKQNKNEKECIQEIKPLQIHPIYSRPFISNICEQDNKIEFDPKEHIYLYKGKDVFMPVSTLINCFFKPFDYNYWSNRKAEERRISQGQVLEEWDRVATSSREIGTFLHLQIENFFNNKIFEDNYHFVYNGTYCKADKFVCISIEHKYFETFVNDNNIIPYKIEWHIFDESLKIAGTIDILCKYKSQYVIYDWKRSKKIVYDNVPIKNNSYGGSGINGLEDIDDTSYWHYCIQQNMYKYILERKYHINIYKMYLVVLHSSYSNYIKVEVPNMEQTIKKMLCVYMHADKNTFGFKS